MLLALFSELQGEACICRLVNSQEGALIGDLTHRIDTLWYVTSNMIILRGHPA
jgi:hypothetical protein